MSHESDLLRRYAESGDQAAFAALVGRQLDLVYSAALRRVGGDARLAEDVAQQVFCDLAANAHRLVSHPMLTGWLYTATRYAAGGILRAETRRKIHEQGAAAEQQLNALTAEPDWSQLRPVLDRVMDQLSNGDRSVVLLRFFEGKTFAEVGERVNLTEDGARLRVNRALEKLRQLLLKEGIGPTLAGLATTLSAHAVATAPSGLAGTLTAIAITHVPAAGGGVVAGIIHFMNSTKLAGSLAVIAISGATFNWAEQHRIEALRAALPSADETRRIEAQLAVLARQSQQREKELQSLTAANAEASSARSTRADQLLAELAKAQLNGPYGAFFRGLTERVGLQPAQLERLKTLIVQQGQSAESVFAAEMANGLKIDPVVGQYLRSHPASLIAAALDHDPAINAQLAQAISSEMSSSEAQIESVIGAGELGQYRNYEQMLSQRSTAELLAQELQDTPNAMSPSQVEQLAQTLQQAPATGGSTEVYLPRGIYTGTSPISDSAVKLAEANLSPLQISALRGMQRQQLVSAEISEGINQGRYHAPANVTASP